VEEEKKTGASKWWYVWSILMSYLLVACLNETWKNGALDDYVEVNAKNIVLLVRDIRDTEHYRCNGSLWWLVIY